MWSCRFNLQYIVCGHRFSYCISCDFHIKLQITMRSMYSNVIWPHCVLPVVSMYLSVISAARPPRHFEYSRQSHQTNMSYTPSFLWSLEAGLGPLFHHRCNEQCQLPPGAVQLGRSPAVTTCLGHALGGFWVWASVSSSTSAGSCNGAKPGISYLWSPIWEHDSRQIIIKP